MSTKENKKSSIVAKVAVVVALIALVAAGVTFAFFTDTESLTNKAHIMEDLDITLVEPSWDETQTYTFVPNETRDKDPQIANDSEVDAWLYATVTVPVAEVAVINPDTNKRDFAEEHELFIYGTKNEQGKVNAHQVCDGWKLLLEDPYYSVDGTTKTYVYYYETPVLATDKTPKPLFEAIELINIVEGQKVADSDFTVDVHAHGIQLSGFEDDPLGGWEALGVQGVRDLVPSTNA